jgi:hypothetical protein
MRRGVSVGGGCPGVALQKESFFLLIEALTSHWGYEREVHPDNKRKQ